MKINFIITFGLILIGIVALGTINSSDATVACEDPLWGVYVSGEEFALATITITDIVLIDVQTHYDFEYDKNTTTTKYQNSFDIDKVEYFPNTNSKIKVNNGTFTDRYGNHEIGKQYDVVYHKYEDEWIIPSICFSSYSLKISEFIDWFESKKTKITDPRFSDIEQQDRYNEYLSDTSLLTTERSLSYLYSIEDPYYDIDTTTRIFVGKITDITTKELPTQRYEDNNFVSLYDVVSFDIEKIYLDNGNNDGNNNNLTIQINHWRLLADDIELTKGESYFVVTSYYSTTGYLEDYAEEVDVFIPVDDSQPSLLYYESYDKPYENYDNVEEEPIICNEDSHSLQFNYRDEPVCVSLESVSKLIERGYLIKN